MVFTTSVARPAAFELVGINSEISTAVIKTFETLALRLKIAISCLLHPPLIGVLWQSLIGNALDKWSNKLRIVNREVAPGHK
jgi:hypothetical protein